MAEKTDLFVYLAQSMYERQLHFVRALKASGAHCYIQSEAYVSSDLISPKLYEKTLYGVQKEFYREVQKIGLIPMCYFTGNINPLLGYIRNIGVKGLLLEESKKNIRLEPGEIIRGLGNSMAVFGNVDSVNLLLRGTPEEVRREAARQLAAADSDFFISNTGSPIPFGTPADTIRAYVGAVRDYKR